MYMWRTIASKNEIECMWWLRPTGGCPSTTCIESGLNAMANEALFEDQLRLSSEIENQVNNKRTRKP